MLLLFASYKLQRESFTVTQTKTYEYELMKNNVALSLAKKQVVIFKILLLITNGNAFIINAILQ